MTDLSLLFRNRNGNKQMVNIVRLSNNRLGSTSKRFSIDDFFDKLSAEIKNIFRQFNTDTSSVSVESMLVIKENVSALNGSYREAISSLRFVTVVTRRNISFSVSHVSQQL